MVWRRREDNVCRPALITIGHTWRSSHDCRQAVCSPSNGVRRSQHSEQIRVVERRGIAQGCLDVLHVPALCRQTGLLVTDIYSLSVFNSPCCLWEILAMLDILLSEA
jgi:hypothetical protein